jgi:hypothetical protein
MIEKKTRNERRTPSRTDRKTNHGLALEEALRSKHKKNPQGYSPRGFFNGYMFMIR